MPRIGFPSSIETAPAGSQAALTAVQKRVGKLPNMFRMLANSPAALTGYLGLNSTISNGALTAQTRERIALVVAEINGCDYCLSGHTYFARLAKLDDIEITANRNGASNDLQADAAVRFAAAITRHRGHVSAAEMRAVQAAGYSNEQIVEIIVVVAMSTLTNYLNAATGTEIDFPLIHARKAA
jgi:uncharacterized peroxidase-related enzyme